MELIFTPGTPEHTLMEFLSYPLNTGEPILNRFASLRGAIRRAGSATGEGFVFVPGARPDAAVLVAHADTYFLTAAGEHKMVLSNGTVSSAEPDAGIGADDRAGCAIAWLLKDSGHHLLILDGEELGRVGASYLMKNFFEIKKIIQASSFMVEFDRRNENEYKIYDLPVTEEFVAYIEKETGFTEPDKRAFSDICTLCTEGCCGVNLSVAYKNEHDQNETLDIAAWKKNYLLFASMLNKPLQKFDLKRP
ncbi:MAG: M28 family metallopeptidase [Defluviitaleaceae bacterium]|nr:M28 family metallopeptidase [Defluviitaleaceae bacterium]